MSRNLNFGPYRALQSSVSRVTHCAATGCAITDTAKRPDAGCGNARFASSQVSSTDVEKSQQQQESLHTAAIHATTPIGERARQKQADREFFVSLISSAATRRDAKAYISRLKSPSKVTNIPARRSSPRPQVNLGGLFRTARAVEQSPIFTQYEAEQDEFKDEETLHAALIKLSDLEQSPDNIVVGVAETLCQLARLSMSPCVLLESSQSTNGELRQQLKLQAERLSTAIDSISNGGSRVIETVLNISESGDLGLSLKKLLAVPLRRGLIPIVLPLAYSEAQQKIVAISANAAMLALTKGFVEARLARLQSTEQLVQKEISLDRLIVIDPVGGIPNSGSADGNHVFLNMQQEFAPVSQQLGRSGDAASKKHLANMEMFRQTLACLPPSASGLIATPEEAANMSGLEHEPGPTSVGTRRQKNALIHNLLTDKPVYSSSLPKSRLSKASGTASLPPAATFVKHGMPLTILPDPSMQPWTADSPRMKLTDSRIDLRRLVHLVDDSFNRELDTEEYLKRVNDRMAGVIIAGDYEGGAILTWETPPGADDGDTDRLVPYLDKFAVLKKSQGAGGVADIVFNAMVRTCFPNGVCWRSRKDNPVNKWYFERSRGTSKIPDMNWTMFWTTPGVPEDSEKFLDYEGVCRGVKPTWLDKKMAAD